MMGLRAVQGLEALEVEAAQDRRFNLAALADVVDNPASPASIAIAIMFLGGATFGILVTTISLWRSRAVPRGAVLLLPIFFILDAPLSEPLIGHVIALVGAAWIATSILSTRRA
jgi:hypothetical protein